MCPFALDHQEWAFRIEYSFFSTVSDNRCNVVSLQNFMDGSQTQRQIVLP